MPRNNLPEAWAVWSGDSDSEEFRLFREHVIEYLNDRYDAGFNGDSECYYGVDSDGMERSGWDCPEADGAELLTIYDFMSMMSIETSEPITEAEESDFSKFINKLDANKP